MQTQKQDRFVAYLHASTLATKMRSDAQRLDVEIVEKEAQRGD